MEITEYLDQVVTHFQTLGFDGTFEEYKPGSYHCCNDDREIIARRNGNTMIQFIGGIQDQDDLANPQKIEKISSLVVNYFADDV